MKVSEVKTKIEEIESSKKDIVDALAVISRAGDKYVVMDWLKERDQDKFENEIEIYLANKYWELGMEFNRLNNLEVN